MSTNNPDQPSAQAPQYAPAPQFDSAGFPTSAAAYAAPKPLPVNTTVKDTNTYALVSIIVTFLVPIAGIVFGHLALSQIKRTGDAGRGLALTALIYGYSVAVLGTLFLVSYLGFILWAVGMATSGGYYY